MQLPRFQADKRKILFFSRGRGRGHALPDVEIVQAIHDARPDVEVLFVSYATGSQTIANAGLPVIDVGLPEEGAAAEMTTIAGKLIGAMRPDVVVSHEEFPVAPAAKIFDLRVSFLLDWFIAQDTYTMSCLRFADEILFLERQGRFDEPEYLNGRVQYVGPFRRRLEYALADRQRARAELGLPSGACVIAVIPGAWATEEREPLADLLIAAFDRLPWADRHLAWIAGSDFERLSNRLATRPDVTLFEHVSPVEQLMVAADVAVTKANRGSFQDLTLLGVPVVAVSRGANSIDDAAAHDTEGVLLASMFELDPGRFAEAIVRQRDVRFSASSAPSCTAQELAARLLAHV